MSSPLSLDSDDDPPTTVPCRRCRRPLARWRTVCPSCGAAQGRTRAPAQAVPVAPPDDELPFADPADEDDDIPIAALAEVEDDIPIAPVVRRRRRRRQPRPPSQ